MKIFFLLLYSTFLFAVLKEHSLYKEQSYPFVKDNIKFLDAKEVVFSKYKGIKFSELSGIEYKNGRVYGISDKGYLYHMSINLKNDRINSLSLDKAIKVKSSQKKSKIDTEGIIFRDDYFYISFEREPKVEKISLNGKSIKIQKIDKELKKLKNYQDANKGLEAIAYSQKYGIITAPEVPLKNKTGFVHILYAKDKAWSVPYKAPLSSMAFMGKNKLLLIQRDFNKKTFKAKVFLTQVDLKKCIFDVCSSDVLLTMNSKKGWNIDNFEGLAKVNKNRFLMISDNNDNPKQKTLLVLFEVLD